MYKNNYISSLWCSDAVTVRQKKQQTGQPGLSTRRALERLQQARLTKYTKDGQKFKIAILPVEP